LRERVAVLVNLLDRHRAENRAQMAFHRLHRDVHDRGGILAQELFGSGGDGNIVALHFDLRHAIDFHRHAFARVNLRRHHIDGEQFKRKDVHLLNDRKNERAAALHDAEAARVLRTVGVHHSILAAGNDEHFVRANLRVTARPDQRENEDDEDDANDREGREAPAGRQRLSE
jgi:hypothetical protein